MSIKVLAMIISMLACIQLVSNASTSTDENSVLGPTKHKDAQWFPKAGLGLFMHWGIHSVDGIQPSWAMIKNYPASDPADYHTVPDYYALAKKFNPQNYDPDKWIAAAKKAGFTYAVLTSKHHDGYALWPTKYGDMSTKQYMGGRDLLKPYVDACRKYGMKVGFYFSPTDWHYPNYPVGDVDFDYNNRGKYHEVDPVVNQKRFDEFYAYTMGQIEELLTRYGKIDILWFDGMGWNGINDIHTKETYTRIRKLQPGIITNNRWSGEAGDYGTPECNLPGQRPSGWWEACFTWNGHWGYNPTRKFESNAWVLQTLITCRKWGGNLLLNCGPAPDGTMPAGFYERCDELAVWMKHSKSSIIGAGPTPGDDLSNVPLTTSRNVWYLHVQPEFKGSSVLVTDQRTPRHINVMRTKLELPYTKDNGQIKIDITEMERTSLDDVIVVSW